MIFLIFLLEPYTWYGPFNISNSKWVESKWEDVVVDRDERLWIVWNEDYYYHPTKMTYRYYTEEGGWSDTFILIKQGANACDSHLSLDSLGRVHWIWSYLPDGGIYWSMYEGGKWREPERIGNDFGHNERISITSSDNRTHIVWSLYGEEKVYYMYFEGDTWSTPQVISGNRRARPLDIASDRHNRIHVIWRNLDTGQLEYIVKVGRTWGEPEVLTDVEGTYIREGKIMVDSQDRVHVVYRTASTKQNIMPHVYYIKKDGSGWTSPYKVDPWDGDEGGGFSPALGVDGKGIVHIMFSSGKSETPWRLMHAIYEGEGWLTYYVKEEPDTLFHGHEGDVELFIDREDNLYVATNVDILPFPREAFEVFLYTTNPDLGIEEMERKYKPVVNVEGREVSIILSESSRVRFFIYDTAGRKMYGKNLGVLNKGKNRVKIDKDLPSGIYFIRFDFDGLSVTKRIIVK